jgi:hypothetical protein
LFGKFIDGNGDDVALALSDENLRSWTLYNERNLDESGSNITNCSVFTDQTSNIPNGDYIDYEI